MQVELPSNHRWRCYGIQLSQNGVFMASAHYPADVFCRQGLKQPLKVRNVCKLKQLRRHLHAPFFAPFLSAAPLIYLTHFNVMCK